MECAYICMDSVKIWVKCDHNCIENIYIYMCVCVNVHIYIWYGFCFYFCNICMTFAYIFNIYIDFVFIYMDLLNMYMEFVFLHEFCICIS